MRGAYGDKGMDDFIDGEPKPDMPLTEYLLVADVAIVGRAGEDGALVKLWRLEFDCELVSEGGVAVPPCSLEVEDELCDPLAFSWVDELLKLVLDLRRKPLRKDGDILQHRRLS